MAQLWRRSGHRVIAVDVMPPLVLAHLTPAAQLAYRVVRMERDDRIVELTRSGVEVVRWLGGDGAGMGLQESLTALSRHRTLR